MNKLLLFFFVSTICLCCKNKNNTNEANVKNEPTAESTVASKINEVYQKLLGSFVGEFGDNKITILITKAEGDSIAGRSIVGGNDRPFSGTVSVKDGKYTVSATEPGDNKYDGTFSFSLLESRANVIEGTWLPNKAGTTPKKEYVLQRKEYSYDINAGAYAKASQRLLKEEDVENLPKTELEFMRNEIFARHGYCFKKKHLRKQFEMENWYVPNATNVTDKLTGIEKKNIELIKRYEKYASEFGDEFGR